jgi:hypothetical protein
MRSQALPSRFLPALSESEGRSNRSVFTGVTRGVAKRRGRLGESSFSAKAPAKFIVSTSPADVNSGTPIPMMSEVSRAHWNRALDRLRLRPQHQRKQGDSTEDLLRDRPAERPARPCGGDRTHSLPTVRQQPPNCPLADRTTGQPAPSPSAGTARAGCGRLWTSRSGSVPQSEIRRPWRQCPGRTWRDPRGRRGCLGKRRLQWSGRRGGFPSRLGQGLSLALNPRDFIRGKHQLPSSHDAAHFMQLHHGPDFGFGNSQLRRDLLQRFHWEWHRFPP